MNKKLTLYLCKSCIDDLQEYNPYIDENGETIRIEDMNIIEVEQKYCQNLLLFKKQKKESK